MLSKRLTAVVSLYDFSSGVNELSSISPLADQETKSRALAQISQIRVHLSEQLPAYMVPTTWLVIQDAPMTTSRKIDRKGIRQWLHEMDEETYQKAADLGDNIVPQGEPSEKEETLRVIIGRVLNLPLGKVSRSSSFLNLGGDSISAMQVIAACRSSKISLAIKDILKSRTITEMASCAVDTRDSTISMVEEHDTAFGLSPMQKMYFDKVFDDSVGSHFNQSFLLRLGQNTSASDIGTAMKLVVQRHSMLRARFHQDSDGLWSQQTLSDASSSYQYLVHNIDQDAVASTISNSQAGLNIKDGPVFRADLMNLATGEQLFFLVAHHLVVDLVSWRIVMKDLEDVLTSGSLSSADEILPFQKWSQLQAKYALEHLQPEKCLPFSIPRADYDYWGMKNRPNKIGDTVDLGFTLDKETSSSLLAGSHEAFGTEPLDVFLSALFHSFSRTFGRLPPTIFNEGHGREPWDSEIDVSSTVGWFTTMFPIHVPLTRGADVIESIKLTKDTRRKLPGNGWPYFASRFLNPDGMKEFSDHWPIEVTFNYLGLYQQLEKKEGLLQLVAEDNHDVGPNVNRMTLIDIYAVVIDGAIRFSFNFNSNMARQDEMRSWIEACKQSLMEHEEKLSSRGPEPTLSDFKLISMEYADLDKFKLQILPSLGLASLNIIEDIYPCSPLQEGILLSQRILTGAYEVQDIFEVQCAEGVVSVERLLKAWQTTVDYHPCLRTIFVENIYKDVSFGQVVVKDHAARIDHVSCNDGDALSALDRLPAMDYSEAVSHHRLSICEAAGRVLCKLEISHSLVDGTSMQILIRDFGLAYEGKLLGEGPLYSDYMAYLQQTPAGDALDYWVKYLSDAKPCHFPLLNDGIVPSSTERQFVKVDLPAASTLYKFCHDHDFTLASLLKAVWALTLSAYTGVDQVCFGYLVAGRDVPVKGINDAIGPFINMLICSMNMEDMKKNSVISVIKTVQDEFFQSLPHQHASLAKIQNAMKLSEVSLFNTVLSYQAVSANEMNKSELSFVGIKGDDPSEVRGLAALCDISTDETTSTISQSKFRQGKTKLRSC
jgi:non-ribosomal peptide synthase protein (TIGR01720 family)